MLSSDDEPQDAEASLIEGGNSLPSAPAEPILAGKASQPGLTSSQPHHRASTPPNFALQAAQAKGAARSPSILLSKPKVKMARPSQAAAVEPTAAAQIRQAILETPACAPIKMPWEQGSWAGIFGLPPSIPSVRFSALPRVPEPPPPPRPLCPVIPRVPGMPAVQASFSRLDDQAERTKAIRMFHTMIIAHPEATATGKQLVKSAKTLLAPGGTLGVMADTLAKSKTGTLVKHASALWKFAAFVQAQNIESPFSANEEHIYHYLCDLRTRKAGPTSGNTFLSAFRYAASTFGLVLPLESLDSKRARGVAHDMFLRKAPRRKAPALSVSAVHRLISLVLAQDIPAEKAAANKAAAEKAAVEKAAAEKVAAEKAAADKAAADKAAADKAAAEKVAAEKAAADQAAAEKAAMDKVAADKAAAEKAAAEKAAAEKAAAEKAAAEKAAADKAAADKAAAEKVAAEKAAADKAAAEKAAAEKVAADKAAAEKAATEKAAAEKAAAEKVAADKAAKAAAAAAAAEKVAAEKAAAEQALAAAKKAALEKAFGHGRRLRSADVSFHMPIRASPEVQEATSPTDNWQLPKPCVFSVIFGPSVFQLLFRPPPGQ